MSIFLHTEYPAFTFKNKRKIKKWLDLVAFNEGKIIGDINFIAVEDSEMLAINKKYLKQNTLTDVIAFNYNGKSKLNGDIFISIDRVDENANLFNVSFHVELSRVMLHGILHLIGYNDKKDSDKVIMKSKEDQYLDEVKF